MEPLVAAVVAVLAVIVGFLLIRGTARLVLGRRRRLEEELAIRLVEGRYRAGEIDKSSRDIAVAAIEGRTREP